MKIIILSKVSAPDRTHNLTQGTNNFGTQCKLFNNFHCVPKFPKFQVDITGLEVYIAS